jgi:predicted transposase YbfD/YdcC
LVRTTQEKGRATIEVQFAVCSLSPERADAAILLNRWRGHWGIENRLHWVRDVSFGEDKCQVKTGHAPQNLAAFRNAAIGLLRQAGVMEIAVALRDFCYRPRKLLQFLGIMKN